MFEPIRDAQLAQPAGLLALDRSPSAASQRTHHSYGQIFSSSVLIGGSLIITILATIVRTKIVAVFLGPAGIGLMGVFGSITSLGLGILGQYVWLILQTTRGRPGYLIDRVESFQPAASGPSVPAAQG